MINKIFRLKNYGGKSMKMVGGEHSERVGLLLKAKCRTIYQMDFHLFVMPVLITIIALITLAGIPITYAAGTVSHPASGINIGIFGLVLIIPLLLTFVSGKKKLFNIIEKGESQELEFKQKPSEDIGKSICSFANTNNGIVLVGVSDKGEITGCNKKHEQQIANIAHTCKPAIYPRIEEVKIDNKLVFAVEVKKSGSLHSCKNIAYERIGTHDKPLSPGEVIQHAKDSGKIRFDSAVCEGATLKDIDEGKVRLFLEEAKKQRGLDIEENSLIEEAMMRLKLLRGEKLTNTAILLFGKNPQHFFLQSEVKCIMFKGTNVTGHMIDMKVIKGDIINQLKKAEDFIFEHIPMAAWIEDWKLQRQEKWMYPPKAIRESLANALAHRDYESTSKVQVRIFDDRIEFWNPGSLPIGWTVETLKQKHESQPRNPLIAKHFFLIKYIEEVGTGTNKIIEWCADWGLPEPEFECTGTSMINTFYNFKYVDNKYLIKLGLNQRQRKVVGYIIENKRITNKELRDLFPTISGETARLNLSGLVKKGILVKHGEKKGAYYSLAYPKNIPNIPNISQESKTLSKKGDAK